MYCTNLNCFVQANQTIGINVVFEKDFNQWLSQQSKVIQAWAKANDWQNKKKQALLSPNTSGEIEQVVIILTNADDWMSLGVLPLQLPCGVYQFCNLDSALLAKAYLAWGMGAYQYTRYRKAKREAAQLAWVSEVNQTEITHILESVYLARDLINTPAEDMMPVNLAEVAKQFAAQYQAQFNETTAEELKQKFPCVYHVGKGSDHQPRLIELHWGDSKHPKVAIVGKGVCFDTGGVNIKPASGMLTMKKDMGGAAQALALARLIMAQNLPIQLHLLVPAVDNAISGNSYRPGDVLTSRLGKTIEITNTDAEGRLVLCDALAAAVEDKPELLIDFATLTGAARIAVGTEISAMFTSDDALAEKLAAIGKTINDPCWRMPLYKPYRSLMDSSIADIRNADLSGYAGAITAALFLQDFVPDTQTWIHFDIMAANTKSSPGKPEGGEAMAMRAVYEYLKEKFA